MNNLHPTLNKTEQTFHGHDNIMFLSDWKIVLKFKDGAPILQTPFFPFQWSTRRH